MSDSQMGSQGYSFRQQLLPNVLPAKLLNLEKGQAYVTIANKKLGPVSAAATIGLYPENGLPTKEEAEHYLEYSFANSFKHPGANKLLPITESYDPYKYLRNDTIMLSGVEVQERFEDETLKSAVVNDNSSNVDPIDSFSDSDENTDLADVNSITSQAIQDELEQSDQSNDKDAIDKKGDFNFLDD